MISSAAAAGAGTGGTTAAGTGGGHGPRMGGWTLAPITFLPPPPNVVRCGELAALVARRRGIATPEGAVDPARPVVVRSRAHGFLGRLTVAFATVEGREVYASEPCGGEMAALADLERVIRGA